MMNLTSTLATTLTVLANQVDPIENSYKWTPEVIIQTKIISDVQLSPDNKTVLFVAAEPQLGEEKGSMLTRIYRTDTAGSQTTIPVTSVENSSMQPRWSPDGMWIAFLSTRDEVKNLYLMSTSGGEIVPLTHSKKDVQTFAWSPDSKKIAFVMADETETEKQKKKSSLAYNYKEEKSINRLWLLDIEDPSPISLTSDSYFVRGAGDFGTLNAEFDWSPDSRKIVFGFSPGSGFDYFYLDSSLAIIDIVSKQVIPLKKHEPFEALPRFSPDGCWIAYLIDNGPHRYTINRCIAIRPISDDTVKLLAPTFNEGPFLSGVSLLGWSEDGKGVLFFEPRNTKYHLLYLPVDGSSAQKIETGETFFKEPSLSFDKTMLAFVSQNPNQAPEVYVSNLENFSPMPVSKLNSAFSSYPALKTERFSWKSDSLTVEGLLTYPSGYEAGKKYPLLLVVHGGPMGFFDESFLGTPNPYPLAAFAEEGFMVLRPNPRGSTGYGKKFRTANYADWGGKDYSDLMAGINFLIEKGLADADRLGVMGWSYGGYMTSWIITQTSRFKAASVGAGPCNLVSMAGTTDLHRFANEYLGDFIGNQEIYTQRSPINFAQNVTTPCLIQHGTEDKRVPVSQAYELYHALERAGKKPSLILYPGMEHRLADPNMQLDAMRSNLTWFKEHLKDIN